MDNQPGHCKNCNEKLSGKYCSNCGQPVFKRFSISYLWRLLYQDLFEIDHGLWKTFKDLMVRPGYMIQDFLGGKTKSYFSPLKYLLVAVTLFYLAVSVELFLEKDQTDLLSFERGREYLFNSHAPFSIEALGDFFNAVLAVLSKGLTFYFLLFIPFLALGCLLVFRRCNFTEYLITLTFMWGQAVILMSITIAFICISKIFTSSESISIVLLCILSASVFFHWVLLFKQLHGLSWIKSFLKFMLALYGSLILFYIILIACFMVLKAMLV